VSSLGSIGGNLDIPSFKNNNVVREVSENAISTLLQPPIVRTGLVPTAFTSASATGYKAPTTKDIPPVTLTNIAHVPPENFKQYLDRIGPLFDTFQRGRAEAEQAVGASNGENGSMLAESRRGRDPSMSPVAHRQSSTGRPSQPTRRSSGQTRRNRNEPTPLSTIPGVYFDENFHLENPRIFDVVSERAEIVRPPTGPNNAEQSLANGSVQPPRKALATNAILQEKLSWYMDTVEVHLINSISTASSGFFAALGSLKGLQTEAEQSIAKIQRLRDDLRRLDQDVAVSGLEVATKKRRRENVRRLGKAAAQVQSVVDNVRIADDLVESGQYDDAADQMDHVGRLVRGKPEPGSSAEDLIDLRQLKALQGLDSGLQELQLRVGSGFSSRFTKTLLQDVRQHVEKVPSTETLKRLSRQRGIPPTYMESGEDFRKELLNALNGLARAGHTAPATAAYREAVNREMKSLIRKYMPSSNDDDADSMVSISTRGGRQLSQQDKSSILARNLRALDAQDAEDLLANVYCAISEALRRVSTQTKILLDVTSSVQSSEPRSPPRINNMASIDGKGITGSPKAPTRASVQEDLSQALDMSSLLGQAVDTAQLQITRVLKVRNEQIIRLSRDQFLRYFTLNRLFADECEAVSGRGGSQLKTIINAQISGFVQVLGTTETERIANLLHTDTWNAEDFNEADDVYLQRILVSMSADPPEWTTGLTPIWEPLTAGSGEAKQKDLSETSTTNGTTSATKTQTKAAYIDDNRYILVSSASSLLSTVEMFLSLTATFPTITPQIATCLLEVLRMFNSRSCQLILGAGARAEGGLKTITTKHLALASQALSFVIALIPYMRECVRRHTPGGQAAALTDFDKTKRLYQDHQTEIHDKLVEIMTSRSQTHARAMRSINFDTVNSPDEKASPYMETLTKETLTLQRVLSRHLSEVYVGMIMQQIFQSYKDQWTKAFAEADVKTPEGQKRLLRDANALETRLGKVDGFGQIGQDIVGIIKAKMTDEQKPSEAPPETETAAAAATTDSTVTEAG
jgi:vacuolar protein sorting-associated protein 54